MKLNIGENIKYFRKEKDITQEELADILGVSFQSVSRWETNLCYPDMELLPSIASFFNVTVDKLIGINEHIEKEKVEKYLNRFQEAISQGQINNCITIAREGVKEYPNNFVLLNKLMYALFVSGDSDGNIPKWKENMEKNDAEITAIGERIMKYCPDQNIRLEATSRLAFNHCEMGRKEIGRAIYDTLPSAEFSRENQIWWGLSDEEKLPFTRERIKQGYDILSAGIYSLISYRLLPDEQIIAVIEKQIALEKIMYDEETPDGSWGKARLLTNYAGALLRLKRENEAFERLQIAAKCVLAFDNRKDEITYTSLLMDDEMIHKADFETDDSRPLREIMRDKWLASPDVVVRFLL